MINTTSIFLTTKGLPARSGLTGMTHPPIPPATDKQKTEIKSLVDQILTAKSTNPDADVAALEKKIDILIAGLFGHE